MKIIYRILLLMIFAASTFQGIAYDLEVDGIYYNKLSSTKLRVVQGPYKYIGNIVIPATVIDRNYTYSVTEIGYQAFRDCQGLTRVEIPNSVTSIGQSAFYGCSGLTGIYVEDGNTSCAPQRGCVKIGAASFCVLCCKTYSKALTFPSRGFDMSQKLIIFVIQS